MTNPKDGKRRLEFHEVISDKLPLDGVHVTGRVYKGAGLITHSREAPEADLTAMRKALETGQPNALAFAVDHITDTIQFSSGVRRPMTSRGTGG